MALTDLACRTAKPQDKQYKLSDGKGLVLICHPNGSKYWSGAYRFAGKQKSLSLGVYPEVSLADARDQWTDARRRLKDGIDPGLAKQQDKLIKIAAAARTFKAVAMEWHTHMAGSGEWGAGSVAEYLHRLETDVFPHIGNDPIDNMPPKRILHVIREMEKRGAIELAGRARGMLARIFNYAIACGDTKVNPADALKDLVKKPVKGHFASIEVEEFPEFIREVVKMQLHGRWTPAVRCGFWLMMRTFVRTQELIAMPWDEWKRDKALWVVPGERMKKRRDHIVPLSWQATALLEEMEALTGRNHYVFPNARDPKDHLSEGAILGVLKRMGYHGRMTGHGFRSLATGVLTQQLKFEYRVVDLQLSHAKDNKNDAAYDRAKWIDERIKIMQAWSDYIDQLVADASRPRLITAVA
ncbi:tyrosine-type recombinase/integrase [Herbaspirillum rubrisubalbicans]|uniref:Integrase n=1 Tax=Herbaspirillum rubrisubalbicans TaxID=80842 RepID=A0AAD0XFJ7_9BURK|nr:integrase arm-type DNA-binding domain-containing protein [Herbaspirillum rubrisubalbicans]AYR24276.1 integrase [Herbaspirillum rubrisubalbicans]